MSSSDKKKFQTEDGYVFYLQDNGTLSDNVDPEMSDLVFESLELLLAEIPSTKEIT